ncbi:hypothetical protein [Labrys neptuniae]
MKTYILLDRSGSMQVRWTEALSAVNVYASDLTKYEESRGSGIVLAVFDGYEGLKFEILRNAMTTADWKPVNPEELVPRGNTPLFDAIGRITALASEEKPERAVFVVMTDGAENASREITREGAKAAFDRCRERGWQVVFLGADFDAFDQAASVGTDRGRTLRTSAGHYAAASKATSARARDYLSKGTEMTYSEEDRNAAVG